MTLKDTSDAVILATIEKILDGVDVPVLPLFDLRRAVELAEDAFKCAKTHGAPLRIVLALSEWMGDAKTMLLDYDRLENERLREENSRLLHHDCRYCYGKIPQSKQALDEVMELREEVASLRDVLWAYYIAAGDIANVNAGSEVWYKVAEVQGCRRIEEKRGIE